MFQIPGRRADSLRIGCYTNFLDTTWQMNLTTEIFKSERSWISFAIECNYPVGNSDISKNVFLKRKDDFIYLRTFSCNYSAKSKRAKPKCLAGRQLSGNCFGFDPLLLYFHGHAEG